MNSKLSGITLLALVIALIAISPVITIASLNTLFGLGIPLTIWTWLSVFWLGFVLTNMISVKKGE